MKRFAAAILALALCFALTSCGGSPFEQAVNKMKKEYPYADNARASDDSYLKIDTKPEGPGYALIADQVEADSLNGIKLVNKELGFSDAVYAKMLQTTALMGRQTEENSKYRVSWTFHPDKGLEVMYEKK